MNISTVTLQKKQGNTSLYEDQNVFKERESGTGVGSKHNIILEKRKERIRILD